MVQQPAGVSRVDDSVALHDLLSRILLPRTVSPSLPFPFMGSLQELNQRLNERPFLDFVNCSLRGVGQVAFCNNPLSGLLICFAVLLQSPWVALMMLVGVCSATVAAQALALGRDNIRNGVLGFNGALVGLAIGTFGLWGNGVGHGGWVIAVIVGAAATALLMKTLGMWMGSKLGVPALALPFHIVTWIFVAFALYVPQSVIELGSPPPLLLSGPTGSFRLLEGLVLGISQVFFSGEFISAFLILIAIVICTPLGAGLALIGCAIAIVTSLLVGVPTDAIYAGLWGYNAVLTTVALGGVFYTPNIRSLVIGSIGAMCTVLVGWGLGWVLVPASLPVLALPFHVVSLAFFFIIRRSLPSLVPVDLYAVASPEEHRFRYQTARDVISDFRRRLESAMRGQYRRDLFDRACEWSRAELRTLFDVIDRNGDGFLEVEEIGRHFQQAGHCSNESELQVFFRTMDVDNSGKIEFEEFGELLLRHSRLMSRYEALQSYFVPIDADGDGIMSIPEINVVLASVDEAALTPSEIEFIQRRINGEPLTWNRFIELLLIV